VLYPAARLLVIERRTTVTRTWRLTALEALLALACVVAVATVVTGGWSVTLFGQRVSFRSLYTPSFALAVLGVTRVLAGYRVRIVPVRRGDVWRVVRLGGWAAVAAVLLLLPRLYALAVMTSEGGFARPPLLWRSSPPGVDALAFVLPNPNHVLTPEPVRTWLAGLPNGAIENVASIPLVALGLLIAAYRRGWRAPRPWGALTVAFVLLALGPFVRIGGFNTALPGPWALLRYVPVVELARSPTRMGVLVMMAIALLFALALRSLREAQGVRRPVLVWVAGAALAFELCPVPRTLSTAAVPGIYARVAADPDPAAHVLELPFGLRDGASSFGDYTARTQFYQTAHGKPLLGGYLSRLSPARVEAVRGVPLLDAFMRLSEGRDATHTVEELTASASELLSETGLAYVVIDRARASEPLVTLANDVLRLDLLAEDGEVALYRPRVAR
jgi:hypothetical protein